MDGTPFGRYQLLDLLGRGGMGEVWRAQDTMNDRVVALKVLPAQWAEDEVFQQRFRREAHAAASLNEPHVVPIHNYGEIEGRLYVEMRLIEGRDLQAVLASGPLIPTRAVAITEQVAMALDAVHQVGLVHRDVKPSNILIARYDFAYLIDFGIARAAQETGLTSAGHLVGTVNYMAPERFRGDDDTDARADVYALACVLEQCLTATAPFAGEGLEQQLMAHLTAPPPRPSQINATVPTEFDAVIARGMAKDPDERFQTVLELAEAAREAIGVAAAAHQQSAAPTIALASQGGSAELPGTVRADLTFTADPVAEPTHAAPAPEEEAEPADRISATRTGASIDELLDHAVSAINRGDRVAASALAEHVLAVDDGNSDAEDLLGAPTDSGEIRRLTILSADLVDPTALALKVEPETYRLLVGRYREQVRQVANRYEGHVSSTKGEGLLVVFGYPHAHEDDVHRAVQAGLEITREVERLSQQAKRRFDAAVDVRVGVHRGLVYLDNTQDDVFGLAANLAEQVSALAPVGSVAISQAVEPLIRNAFEVETLPVAPMGGTDDVINPFRVVGERVETSSAPLGPLVGRDRELARLTKSWARAQAGTLTVPGVVLRGEAGIGKSRLAAAATEMVQRDGGIVLELMGSPVHADVGLHPVRILLERRCGITRLTEPERRFQLLQAEVTARGLDPETAIPLLAPVIGLDAAHGYEPMQAEGRKLQELIAEALKGYLLACFGGASGLLVAEDAHWFDPSTLELLGALLNATEGRLFVVVTGRDGNWLSDQWPAKVLNLLPLTDEQCDELVRTLSPTVSPEDCAAVRTRCDGVPFYIEQVVSGLGSSSEGNRPAVPDPLYEPLFARLLATANVAPVVEAAAIIGRHVDRGLLVAVSSLSEDEVDDVIDELEDAKVFEPQGQDAWRFRHELLREVAAEMAPPSVRRGLHGKVADALMQGAAGDPDWRLVAAHYEQAERHVDAASAYQRASADARRRGALEEARMYLSHALTQLESCPSDPERDRLEVRSRLERGFLTSAAEGYQSPSVAVDFERGLQLLGTDLRNDQLFGTLCAASTYYISRADLRRAKQLVDTLKLGQEEKSQWFSPAIDALAGMVAFLRGAYAEARPFFEQAIAGLSEDDEHRMEDLWFIPHDAVASAYEHLAIDKVLHGDVAAAETDIANAMRRADDLDFPLGPYNHVYAIDMEIWMRVEAGHFDRARELAADMIEKAERYGFDFWQMFGYTEQSMIEAESSLRADDLDADALTAQIDSLTGFTDFWRSVGLYAYQTHYDCIVAQLLNAAGRRDEAQTRINAALEIADDTEMHFYDAELLRARSHTHVDPDMRAADLGVAIQLARHQDAPLFELRAAIDDFELRGEDARAALADAVNRLPADCALPEVARGRAILS